VGSLVVNQKHGYLWAWDVKSKALGWRRVGHFSCLSNHLHDFMRWH